MICRVWGANPSRRYQNKSFDLVQDMTNRYVPALAQLQGGPYQDRGVKRWDKVAHYRVGTPTVGRKDPDTEAIER